MKKFIILIIMLMLTTLLTLMLGDSFIAPQNVLSGLFKLGDPYTNLVINTLRLPRVLLAIVTGAALGIAGCVLQFITKNPLASPDVIGISQGANVGSLVFLIVLTTSTEALLLPIAYQPIFSMLGAIIVTALLYFLAMRKSYKRDRLILIGISFNILCQAIVMFLILTSNKRSAQAQIWITGSVHQAEYQQVMIVGSILFIVMVILTYYARSFDIHYLGINLSLALGNPYQHISIIALISMSILIGISMSYVGGIQFVGLIAPHIALKLGAHQFRNRIFYSAIIGAIILLLSDLIGRTLFLPKEIPAGIFTALIGSPFFMYLLIKSRK
ncbi:FecCD family ABC transporter permease [Mammaliicoccus sciuri]|uniref:FecCD family ABC transporter permease n=1 Tax=Mammaliicoccus sciuri TaxID=1296 RepID=UPI00132FD1CF|nr:iron ABC transporter permease [Mammaliicoccus sciuri]MCD3219658.1 iron ABC transporter permease [Mammaliicoccus sciuri]MCJ0909925.1 iron ABC transporter permease [Mammaliicoccus sciuri]MCJ1761487.1 iron ABC transporter permease [Mammaliicoccus sciuri]MDO0952855.1 iron ABC transporter permease [Mammaliicoccus sciuri]MDT0756524.1 iron ABC transporter permease [Mammaliicoccus sciuri]